MAYSGRELGSLLCFFFSSNVPFFFLAALGLYIYNIRRITQFALSHIAMHSHSVAAFNLCACISVHIELCQKLKMVPFYVALIQIHIYTHSTFFFFKHRPLLVVSALLSICFDSLSLHICSCIKAKTSCWMVAKRLNWISFALWRMCIWTTFRKAFFPPISISLSMLSLFRTQAFSWHCGSNIDF